MCCRVHSNEQFIWEYVKNKMIFFNKWPSTGHLEVYLAKSLLEVQKPKINVGGKNVIVKDKHNKSKPKNQRDLHH